MSVTHEIPPILRTDGIANNNISVLSSSIENHHQTELLNGELEEEDTNNITEIITVNVECTVKETELTKGSDTTTNYTQQTTTNSDVIASAEPPKQSWLLRLFESKLFDMTIAITYLFNSKEIGQYT